MQRTPRLAGCFHNRGSPPEPGQRVFAFARIWKERFGFWVKIYCENQNLVFELKLWKAKPGRSHPQTALLSLWAWTSSSWMENSQCSAATEVDAYKRTKITKKCLCLLQKVTYLCSDNLKARDAQKVAQSAEKWLKVLKSRSHLNCQLSTFCSRSRCSKATSKEIQ